VAHLVETLVSGFCRPVAVRLKGGHYTESPFGSKR
jgi:hypothetical protein